MIEALNREIRVCNNYIRAINRAKTKLQSAFNNLDPICDLSGKFTIDGIGADNNEIRAQQDRITETISYMDRTISRVNSRIATLRRRIAEEEAKLAAIIV